MKKIVSITLVALLLLNAMGYHFIFMGVEFRHDSNMARRFDSESFNLSQTITLKVPMAIPYSTGNEDFNRVDGKFTHEGQVYRLIKQRYLNDTLTVICIRDYNDEKINDALGDYVKTFTDSKSDHQSNGKISFSFIKDFISQSFCVKSTSFGWEIAAVKNSFTVSLTSSYCASIVHPPERA